MVHPDEDKQEEEEEEEKEHQQEEEEGCFSVDSPVYNPPSQNPEGRLRRKVSDQIRNLGHLGKRRRTPPRRGGYDDIIDGNGTDYEAFVPPPSPKRQKTVNACVGTELGMKVVMKNAST